MMKMASFKQWDWKERTAKYLPEFWCNLIGNIFHTKSIIFVKKVNNSFCGRLVFISIHAREEKRKEIAYNYIST